MNLRYRDERRPLSGKSGMEATASPSRGDSHGVAFVAGRFVWSKLTRAVHDAMVRRRTPHLAPPRVAPSATPRTPTPSPPRQPPPLPPLRAIPHTLGTHLPRETRLPRAQHRTRRLLRVPQQTNTMARTLRPRALPPPHARPRQTQRRRRASVPVARRVIRRKPKTRRRERVVERIRIRNRPRAIDSGGRRTRTRNRNPTVRGVRGETSDRAVRGGTVRTRALLARARGACGSAGLMARSAEVVESRRVG